jgi:hypothetical protein
MIETEREILLGACRDDQVIRVAAYYLVVEAVIRGAAHTATFVPATIAFNRNATLYPPC